MHPDRTRPRLHLTAGSGWINDPLGLTWHDGRYHLFFQHVPGRTSWAAEQHWGHATSTDLLHWTEHAPVLAPGDGDDGVWSGSLVVPPDGADAVIFYTSAAPPPHDHVGRARIAHPVDASWTAWTKGAVVARLPEGLDVTAYRDPYVVHDGTSWLMLMGAGLTDGTATVLAYRSDDLRDWAYDGPLLSRHGSVTEPLWTGTGWECPQLLRVDGRWVLVVSVWEPGRPHDQVYAVGDLVAGRFVPERWAPLSAGLCHYAGSAFTDADGRPGLIHWLRGVAGDRWAGAHSVPHTLALDGDRLVARPHAALTAARQPEPVPVGPGTAVLPPVADVEWSVPAGSRAELTVSDDDGDVVRLEVADRTLTLATPSRTTAFPLVGDLVRVLFDGPTLEVFTDGGVLGAPVRPTGREGRLTAAGSGVAVVHAVA